MKSYQAYLMTLEQSLESEKMIIAKQSSNSTSDFKLPPAGSFLARLYRIIDIGTQCDCID